MVIRAFRVYEVRSDSITCNLHPEGRRLYRKIQAFTQDLSPDPIRFLKKLINEVAA